MASTFSRKKSDMTTSRHKDTYGTLNMIAKPLMEMAVRTLIVSMMWVNPFSTSTALLWLISSKLIPLAARTWSPTLIPLSSANPPGSTLKKGQTQSYLTLLWIGQSGVIFQHNIGHKWSHKDLTCQQVKLGVWTQTESKKQIWHTKFYTPKSFSFNATLQKK